MGTLRYSQLSWSYGRSCDLKSWKVAAHLKTWRHYSMEAKGPEPQLHFLGAKVFRKLDSFDKWLSLSVHRSGAVIPRWTLYALEHSGDGRFSIPIPAAIWLAPVLLGSQELRCFLLNLFVAFMFDLIFVGVVKSIIRRPRPIYNKGMYVFVAADQWSFPSGHSSRVVMIATFFWLYKFMWTSLISEKVVPSLMPHLHQMYSGSGSLLLGLKHVIAPAILALLTSWALATAASRILLGRHYVMDVVVGGALGVAEAFVLHHFFRIPVDVSLALHKSFVAKLGVASAV